MRYTNLLSTSIFCLSAVVCAAVPVAHSQELPGFPAPAEAPAGAPNVLIVMTDDVGFGASSTFGGAIPTPNLDRLAANGLRYSNFHTTGLCSPSRAALLTGRNHHAVGFGSVSDFATGQPGYNSIIPKSAATIAQVLHSNGYNSAFFGKNHNVPTWQAGPTGPFDQWGTGLGFDYFYGFHAGKTDQFSPDLFENTLPVEPRREPGYFLDRDLADHAIDWLHAQRAAGASKPFLLYLAPGTAHAPVQAPTVWIEKFRGKFDGGWDKYRAAAFARQKQMGLIPASAVLPPRPPGVPAWSSLSTDQRKVYARFMEVYAAALACFDDQFGRVIDALRDSGQLDNTLVIFIQGDNGATPEGGANGAVNSLGRTSPKVELDWALKHLNDIGGPNSYPVGPAGWAVALNTPFPYYKVVASQLGGTTNGLVVSWPTRIKTAGMRHQFLDLTDIAPTLYDAIGIKPPEVIDGVAQQPFDGASFVATFANARAASPHPTQYFEIFGNAAIYDRGWMLSNRLAASNQAMQVLPDLAAPWMLFDLTSDPTQTTDVAAQHPEKARELRELFDIEAKRNHVFPLQTSIDRLASYYRPNPGNAPGRYVFHPGRWVYGESSFPTIVGRDWAVTADLTVPASGASGTLVTQGGRFQGWGLLMRDGVPLFSYRMSDRPDAITRLVGDKPLPPGRHKVAVKLVRNDGGKSPGGTLTLAVDGTNVRTARIPQLAPYRLNNEPAVIGRDTGTTLEGDPYPFAWPAALTVTLDAGPIDVPEK